MTAFLALTTGFIAGILSGLFGIGGATIIIPTLIFLFGYNQHQAQGTTLAAMIPPIGLLAAIRYYYGGNVVIDVAIYIAIGFLFGGLLGAVIAHPIPDVILKRLFAAYLIILGIRMLF